MRLRIVADFWYLAMPEERPVLVAETSDVRPFARLLRGIGLKHNAVMTVSKAGFEVTVEEVRSLCATAWIPTNLFTTFEFPDDADPECFEISLDALLQCLNIFGNAGSGSAPVVGPARKRRWAGEGEAGEEEEWRTKGRGERRTGMRMSWQGQGFPLSVLLRDDAKGPVTTCDLYTLEPEELLNQAFNDEDRAVYLIMKSEWFRDALLDLPPSCTRVTLRCLPRDEDETRIKGSKQASVGSCSIHAEGDFGSVQFDYPNDREVMDAFDCDEPVTFSYHAQHIALLGRALQHSIKVCLQIERTGFLSVQVMMPIPDNMPANMHNGILEFKMHALEDEDEE